MTVFLIRSLLPSRSCRATSVSARSRRASSSLYGRGERMQEKSCPGGGSSGSGERSVRRSEPLGGARRPSASVPNRSSEPRRQRFFLAIAKTGPYSESNSGGDEIFAAKQRRVESPSPETGGR